MALLYKIKKDHLFLIQYSKNLKTLKNSLKKRLIHALKLSFSFNTCPPEQGITVIY